MKQARIVAASLAVSISVPTANARTQTVAAVVTQQQPSLATPASGDRQAAFSAAAVDDGDLGKATGREDTATMIASATQRNTVANNSVTGNSVTGDVDIDGNAFQNLQGLAVISANSGNNVAINSAMNVTINLVH